MLTDDTLNAPLLHRLRGEVVRVHFNLHRGDWAISDRSTGKVILYVHDVTLSSVTFVVYRPATPGAGG